jgi:small basic protein
MNITLGLLGVTILALLARHPDVATKLQLSSFSVWSSAVLIIILMAASTFALFGRRNGHLVMLAAAIVYFGLVIYQNAALLNQADAIFNQDGKTKLWSNIIRTGIELALNLWVALSKKTRIYFSSRQDVPDSSFKADASGAA